MPFLSPNEQCQTTEGKNVTFHGLATPSSPGVFQLRLWPLIAPGYLGRVAMPLINPLTGSLHVLRVPFVVTTISDISCCTKSTRGREMHSGSSLPRLSQKLAIKMSIVMLLTAVRCCLSNIITVPWFLLFSMRHCLHMPQRCSATFLKHFTNGTFFPIQLFFLGRL